MKNLELLHDQIAGRLSEIESLFKNPDDYRLTLLARNVKNPNAHIIVSSEEIEERFYRVRQGLDEIKQNGVDVGRELPSEGSGDA